MKEDIFASYIYALEHIDPDRIRAIAESLSRRVDNLGRIFTAGNGGSHAIAQHLASDIMKAVGDQKTKSCSAICLTDNVSIFTAIGNDIGYEQVFSVQAAFHDITCNDVVLAFSVSGDSPNILKLAEFAWQRGAMVVMVSGNSLENRYTGQRWHGTDSTYLYVHTGLALEIKSPLHYYVCESVFSCIAHAIANEFHKCRGNYVESPTTRKEGDESAQTQAE